MAKENQHQLNQRIKQFILDKDKKKQSYSNADIEFINQYEGAGGQGSKGASGEGVLYEFFTPDYIAEIMYKLALFHGYKEGGKIIETSAGTGRLLIPFHKKNSCTAFEINKTSARICELNNPKTKVYKYYFEQAFLQPERFTSRIKGKEITWLKQYPFDMVLGNPPYGKYKNSYSCYFTKPKLPQIEQFFFYYGLKLLKPGGLLVYLVSSNFLRNGISYNKAKYEIGKIADIIDAYRLPSVFKFSEVPTDIIVLKRK